MITRTCQGPKRDGSPGLCDIAFEQPDYVHDGSGSVRKYCSHGCQQNHYMMRRFAGAAIRRALSADLKAELRARGVWDNSEVAAPARWSE